MNDPVYISAICVTYGRTKLLEEAISCFIDQDYSGPKELIVFNTCPDQKLSLPVDFKRWNTAGEAHIKFHNCHERPKTLGESRNAAIKMSSGSHIVVWDDDNVYRENFLSAFAKHFEPGIDYVWLDKQLYSEAGKIKSVMQGSTNVFAHTRSAWEKVGGYSQLTVGEDKEFVGRITAATQGKKVILPNSDICFVYCWGNGAYHISGLGEDIGKGMSAHERIEQDFIKRAVEGLEPTGDIVLNPKKTDWNSKIESFIVDHFKTSPKKNAVAIVMLGRYGDIINVLPIAKRIADRYDKPHFIIAREFASVLEGVSYVEPVVLDVVNNEVNKALEFAKKNYQHVLCAQIWGRNFAQVRMTEAYNVESWRNCGFLRLFNDRTLKPVFDLRNKEREQQLVNYVSERRKFKYIVTSFRSISSPYQNAEKLMQLIGEQFADKYRIVDLSNVRAERIYDLIGLFESAECVVSVDSAPLHLAAACDVPVVALVNPAPWLGTVPRCNCAARIPYDAADRDPRQVLKAIQKAINA